MKKHNYTFTDYKQGFRYAFPLTTLTLEQAIINVRGYIAHDRFKFDPEQLIIVTQEVGEGA